MIHGQELIILVLTLTVSILSVACSAVNIILINSLDRFNYFLKVLWYMCICQMFYDATFYLHRCIYVDVYVFAISQLLNTFGGLSVSFWTNVLAWVLMNIIFRKQARELTERFWLHFIVVCGTSLAVGIAGVISIFMNNRFAYYIVEMVYYIIRLLSIAFNIIGFYCIYYRIELMMKGGKSKIDVSIVVLSRRLMFYPLVQFLTRIVTAIYEAEYGFGSYTNHVSTNQFIMRCFICLLQPAAGIGFLIVFLIFQPKALEHLIMIYKTGKISNFNAAKTNQLNCTGTNSSNVKTNSKADSVITCENPVYSSNSYEYKSSESTKSIHSPTNTVGSSFSIKEQSSSRDTVEYLLDKYSELDDHDLCSIVRNSSNTNAPQYYHNSRLESVD